MPSCFAPFCTHNLEIHKCEFFSFPSDIKVRRKWVNLVRRADREVDTYSRLCSCHFRNLDPNTLPDIFPWNEGKKLQFTSPERLTRKKRRIISEIQLSDNVENSPNVEPSASKVHDFSSTFYKSEKYFLMQEIESLKMEVKRLTTHSFGFFSIFNDDKKCLYYTGLHLAVFEIIEKLCASLTLECYGGKNINIIPFKDQLLLTLVKLRLNLGYYDLASRFGISLTTAFRIVSTFIPHLHKILCQSIMEKIPSRRKNESCLPTAFASLTVY